MEENTQQPQVTQPAPEITQQPVVLNNPPQKKSLLPRFAIIGIVLVAISIGVVLYLSNSKPQPTQQVAAPVKKQMFLTISSPTSTTTAVNGEILVSGSTLPETTVVIYSDVDETIIDSDMQGNFESTVIVGEGGVVRITAFASTGEETTQTFELMKNEELSYADTVMVLGVNDKKENPGKADTQKPDNARTTQNKPNSTDSTIDRQTKTNPAKQQRELQPAEKAAKEKIVNDFLTTRAVTTKPAKIGGPRLKEVLKAGTESAKFSQQLKVEKLAAKIASGGATLKRHAVSGIVTSVSGTMLTVTHQIQQDTTHTVYYNANTLIHSKGAPSTDASTSAQLSNTTTLIAGMRITAVGTPIDDGLLANRIHVIPGKANGVFNKQPISSPSGTLEVTPTASGTATPTIEMTMTPTISVTVTPTVLPTQTLTPTPTL